MAEPRPETGYWGDSGADEVWQTYPALGMREQEDLEFLRKGT